MTRSIANALLLLSIFASALVEVSGVNISPNLATPSPPPPPQPATSPPSPLTLQPTTPLCDQEQLILVATTIAKLELKKQCEEAIHEPEMLQTGLPEAVCATPSCVAALQTMYRSLPRCRFRDWDVQFHAEMLLRNCGIKPQDATQAPDTNDCSYDTADSASDTSFTADSSSGNGRRASFSAHEAFAREQQPSSTLLHSDDSNK